MNDFYIGSHGHFSLLKDKYNAVQSNKNDDFFFFTVLILKKVLSRYFHQFYSFCEIGMHEIEAFV